MQMHEHDFLENWDLCVLGRKGALVLSRKQKEIISEMSDVSRAVCKFVSRSIVAATTRSSSSLSSAMDVDASPAPRNDELITYFATRLEEFAWNNDVREQILTRRAAMSGVLFFDILLQLGGINDSVSLYPPTNLQGLKRLLDAIETASYDTMKRDCLIYYLLKQSSDGREVGYVSEKVISPHYVALADSYWELDSGINLEGALAKLSDARIVKEYTTKIMETLQLHPNSAALIRKFVRTCKPVLCGQADMERYIIATAEHSITEAWKYQRTFPAKYPPRKTLLYKVLEWTLTPKPKPQPLTQMLALPFSRYEENTLQEFAIHPPETLPPASVGVVRDMVCVRLIQNCKYAAAVRFDRQYPSSQIGPRGTWSSERNRIVKEVLSIMPAAQRSMLENELNALGEDARIRTSSTGSTSANQSWTTNMAASGSTDLGASWEDVGRRTAGATRKSFGGRPRTSLSSGMAAKMQAVNPGASMSSTWQDQPLSAQSTVVSQNGTASTSADSPSRLFSHTANNSTDSPTSAARLHAQKAPTHSKPNGVANGTPKRNAFTGHNAFFQPPEVRRSPSPELVEMPRRTAPASASPIRAPVRPAARLPTPPQDDTEKVQENTDADEQILNGRTDTISSASTDKEGEENSAGSERGDLGYSMFNGTMPGTSPATRLTPSSGETSPKNGRKPSRGEFEFDEGVENQRKKLRVSVPGAFVTDDDHEPELPSPTSATVNKPNLRSTPSRTMRRTPSRTTASRPLSSRKRAASPDDNNDIRHLSIPGTLYEEDEEDSSKLANGRAGDHSPADSEAADELAPLPTHRSRRKTDPTASLASSAGTLRTPRRSTRSVRGSSAEPDEGPGLISQSTGRPVRRSMRIHSGEMSPSIEHTNMFDMKFKKEGKKEKDGRPKKSTRTAGSGATATGRGATKRK